jgi:hypothetical protein
MPGENIKIINQSSQLINELQVSLASGKRVVAQLQNSSEGGVQTVSFKNESRGARLGLNLITFGLYGSVRDHQVKASLAALLNQEFQGFTLSGQADAANQIQNTLGQLQQTSASNLLNRNGTALGLIKQSIDLANATLLTGLDVRTRSPSGASFQEAIRTQFAQQVEGAKVSEDSPQTVAAENREQDEALTRLRSGLKFDRTDQGIHLSLNESGLREIQPEDFHQLDAWLIENGIIDQVLGTRVSNKQKIVSIDLSGAKQINQSTLLDIGNQLPFLTTLRAENVSNLTEIDHVKNYVQQYFTSKKNAALPALSSLPSHRAILNYLDKSLFRSGTQHTYFQELKYKYARESLLNDFPGNRKFAGFLLGSHQRECVGIVLNDIFQHKIHGGERLKKDADLPNSHNGATRATLTHEDLQLLNKGLTEASDLGGAASITGEARQAIQAEFTKRKSEFINHLGSVQEAIRNAIPDQITIPATNSEATQTVDNPYKKIDDANPSGPRKINYPAVLSDLKSEDPEKRKLAAQVAVEIKAAGVAFADKQGRNFALADFSHIGADLEINSELRSTLSTIATLSDTFSAEIDEATLHWLIKENQKAPTHPRVGIVGGGPTGLFAGLEFYAKGADVKISEIRNELYHRHQIVRLDPLWVNKLKFYLGTEFEKYFGAEDKAYLGMTKPRIGNRSGDGFVETVINHLEDRLLDRVVLLNSLAENGPKQVASNGNPIIPGIQVLTAHDVDPKVIVGDHDFALKSKYNKKGDELKIETLGVDAQGKPINNLTVVPSAESLASSSDGSDLRYQKGEEIPVDLIFDCAGKHSPFKEGNTISRDVTKEEPHIVASFFVRGECLSYRQENHDFRRQYLITPDFIKNSNEAIQRSTKQFFESLSSTIDPETKVVQLGGRRFDQEAFNKLSDNVNGVVQALASEYLTEDIEAYKRIPVQGGQRQDNDSEEGQPSLVYETRTFVNTSNDFQEAPDAKARLDGGVAQQADGKDRPDNIVYLGLELPKPVDKFQKALYKELLATLTTEIPAEDERKKVARAIVNEANLGFVLTIAHEQGLDRPRTDEPNSEPWVSAINADRKFLSAFDVSQGSVPNGVLVRENPTNGKVIIQASGGDSAAAPHFMRYSGLSGAREHVGIISSLVGHIAALGHSNDNRKGEVLRMEARTANRQYESINDFVLSRGQVFLESASPLEVAQNVRKELTKLLSPGKNGGHFLQNVRSQAEAASILRTQLTKELAQSKRATVEPEVQAVWEEIEAVISDLEAGRYQYS